MEVIYVLLPVALLFAAVAVAVFLWATFSGQYDDLDTPAVRMLYDEDTPPEAPPRDEARTRSA